MSENTEHTLTAYKGPEFQQKLMWQLLVEPEYAEKTIPILAVEYFDDSNFKRLFLIVLEYMKLYGKVPNLQNQSIKQAINEFKTPNNVIEEESLFAVVERIRLWNERILNESLMHDGEVVQESTTMFIKQQEYRKFAEEILIKVKNGQIKDKYAVAEIEERLRKISLIGNKEDNGIDVTESLEKALRKEFRKTIPTGVKTIDSLTGGGLGKGEIGLILTPTGVGKAQPLSSQILTPDGWIRMGDIKVDDLVIGSDGRPQRVLGVYPQGKRPIYKIEFNDQTSIFCDKEHLWAVNSHKQRNQKTNINGKTLSIPDHTFQILKTSEIMEDVKIRGGLNYRLPNVSPIQFNKRDVKIDPYVMGILLGDGCLTRKNQPHIITSDLFIVDKIRGLEKNIAIHEYEGRKENYKKLYRISLLNSRNILDNELNLYGTDSSTKFIPNVYLYNCVEFREKLLQGLIDSDGGIGKNNAIVYSTVSKKLSENVRELVLSLGGTCRITEKYRTYTNKDGLKVLGKKNYSLTISFPNNGIIPCTLPAKLNRVVIRDKYKYNKFIKNIEYSHEEEAQCIYVDSDDHLYVTDDYILTHNTTLLTKIANTAREHNYNVLQIIFEDTIEQIQRKHVTIWTEIALSELDERNEEALEKSRKHINAMGPGKLTIKKFSQEDTTMRDVKDFIIREQKRTGVKYDIVVLDYLDCLESHKRAPDRNEAELVIIKSFEAMASDLDIPCWSAIQSNRSGIGAELVEAQQTGGNIKRVQKAHFFMSVAKTPDQQEASLANIRIIKARMVKDGQTFKDCIFNNDTMQIIINDPRYVGTANDTKKKLAYDVRAENIEKHAGGSGLINVALSAALPDTSEDPLEKDMRDKYMRDNNIVEPQTVKEIPVVKNDDVNEGVIEGVIEIPKYTVVDRTDELLEIEDVSIEDVPIEEIEGIIEGITEGIKEPILELTGDIEIIKTTEIEIKLEDLPSKGLNLKENIVIKPIEIPEEPKKITVIKKKIDLDELEKRMLINPDDVSPAQKNMHDYLVKLRVNDGVVKKE